MNFIETIQRDASTRFPSFDLIKENKAQYTKHDLLFKRLIETFFTVFMEAFFPEFYKKIDFRSMKFLSEEITPDVHDENKKILDIIVEVKWKETDTVIVIHVEPQSYLQTNFHKRMFHYFSLLYRKINKPILPIAIFSYDDAWDQNEFNMKVGTLEILRFKYLTLHVRKMNWQQFIRKENPVSAALLSKMGYGESERVKAKLAFFRILTKLKINFEKRDILIDFFQSYLQLSEQEEEILMKEVEKLEEAEEIFEITNPYVEHGKALGREEGKEEVALEMLKKGFSIELIAEVTKLTHEEVERLKEQL